MRDALVHQLGRGAGNGVASSSGTNANNGDGIDPLRTYKFYSIFPTSVSAIDLSYDSSDTIEEYSVEFQVQYWTAEKTDATGQEIK
jgi:hypothetical protein